MIIFVTDKQVRKNFRSIGFSKLEGDVVGVINTTTFNFVKNVLRKTLDKYKGVAEIDGHHVHVGGGCKCNQAGGRVLMPAEYYGVSTNHYIDAAKGTDMSVTDEWIRPAFVASDAVMEGGNHGGFHLPLQSIKNMCAEIMNTSRKGSVTLKQSAYKHIQQEYLAKMDKVCASLRRRVKGDTLTKKDLVEVFAMAKYKAFA